MNVAAGLFAALTLAVGVAPAQAAAYSNLYVFGDSLVDAGNANLGTGGAQASPTDGYYQGRFSNGLNFADYLGEALTGHATVPFLAGGTNAAVGGALALQVPGETSPSFLSQIAIFKTAPVHSIAADALVLVTFGGNDVRATALAGGTPDFAPSGADLLTGLNALYALGARNFVITGAPDIGLLPSARPLGAIPGRLSALSDRSVAISDLFEQDANTLDAKAGTNVTFFDLYDYEHDLLADPTAYGLPSTLNTTTPCQIPGGGSPQLTNCANSLYFDGIHPTTKVHLAIANAILAQLPEPTTWGMMLVGFGLVGGTLRRRTPRPGAAHAA